MITDLAYQQGVDSAWGAFMKTSGVPLTTFPKKVPAVPAVPAMLGGAAAPAAVAATPAVAPGKPGFMDSWKGQALMSLGAPLAMQGISNMMTPAQPQQNPPLQ